MAGDSRVTGIDALSRSGAHELAERIIRYWEERSYKPPQVWVDQNVDYRGERSETTFVVRSNMVGGLPR